jgi:hypothetical protein
MIAIIFHESRTALADVERRDTAAAMTPLGPAH